MGWRFDPVTQSLVLIDELDSGSKRDILKSILLESDETLTLPKASILFDKDSILYQDDEDFEC
jgi:hypothetical protein